jgi:hypothetical protein
MAPDLEEFDYVNVCMENQHHGLTEHGISASHSQTELKTSCLYHQAAVVLTEGEDKCTAAIQNVFNYL